MDGICMEESLDGAGGEAPLRTCVEEVCLLDRGDIYSNSEVTESPLLLPSCSCSWRCLKQDFLVKPMAGGGLVWGPVDFVSSFCG
ncbi:hypothetical protein CHARACLAT_022317 [Characodon lateralis]|uniref:Uncharacterized protein n=1 Tax=Characodon lateralis TaxID=208331 RepID=A0ABU7F552_9TELE|nr:hypothetical protein [Characodon lateralis]